MWWFLVRPRSDFQGAGFRNGGASASTGRGMRVLLFGLALVGLGMWWRQKSEARPTPAAPTLARPDFSAWRGSWEQTGGNALILVKDDGSGVYSPDGKLTIAFRATVSGDEAVFRVRMKGRQWKLRLTSEGHLTGLPETPPPAAPVVISPGRSQAERDAETEKRKADTKAMLVPTDLGTFKRT